jgi:hypothetical protein
VELPAELHGRLSSQRRHRRFSISPVPWPGPGLAPTWSSSTSTASGGRPGRPAASGSTHSRARRRERAARRRRRRRRAPGLRNRAAPLGDAAALVPDVRPSCLRRGR